MTPPDLRAELGRKEKCLLAAETEILALRAEVERFETVLRIRDEVIDSLRHDLFEDALPRATKADSITASAPAQRAA